MKVVGIIQARLSSTRLPGKILAPIAGMPLLQLLATRIQTPRVSEWWLATSTEPEDALTAEWGRAIGLKVYRGSVDDVLSRFTAIIDQTRPDWVVRATADDPFMDGPVVEKLMDALPSVPAGCHALASEQPRTLPLGYVPELLRASALLELGRQIPSSQAHHRSHVSSLLYERHEDHHVDIPWPARPHWRWTVDTAADLEVAQRVFALLGPGRVRAPYGELVALLDGRPDLTDLNRSVRQKTPGEG